MNIKLEQLLELMYANDLVEVKNFHTDKRMIYGDSNDILVFSKHIDCIVMSMYPIQNKLIVNVLNQYDYEEYKSKEGNM